MTGIEMPLDAEARPVLERFIDVLRCSFWLQTKGVSAQIKSIPSSMILRHMKPGAELRQRIFTIEILRSGMIAHLSGA